MSAFFDPVAKLQAAGIPVDLLSDEQLTALATLSEAEVEVLTDIARRLADAEPDVLAHGEVIGGLFF